MYRLLSVLALSAILVGSNLAFAAEHGGTTLATKKKVKKAKKKAAAPAATVPAGQ